MRYAVAFALGFSASRVLYQFTHSGDFPEVGRYAVGVILLAVVLRVFGFEQGDIEQFLLAAFATGAGVAIARIVR